MASSFSISYAISEISESIGGYGEPSEILIVMVQVDNEIEKSEGRAVVGGLK
jgi:hypothetical protein